jgi:hypothetical protein
MTAGSNAVRSVEHLPNLEEVPPNSAAFVIDFFEARHRCSQNLRGVFFMLIERRIAVIGGTSGIGFAVESKGLHSLAWRVGQPGDAF